jgi:hypothetical protein
VAWQAEAPPTARWSREEDERLRLGLEQMGPEQVDWDRLATVYLQGRRSQKECYERWERTIKVHAHTTRN